MRITEAQNKRSAFEISRSERPRRGETAVSASQFKDIYFKFEELVSAIDKCRLKKEHRELVNSKASNFRQAVIALGKPKKSKVENK